MKQFNNIGGGKLPYLTPEVSTTEIAVERGFAASETFPSGGARPFDAWDDESQDEY